MDSFKGAGSVLDAQANAMQFVDGSVLSGMAAEIDRAALFGSGSEAEPQGIFNTAGIQTVTGVGTPSSYASISNAVGTILDADYPGEPDSLGWAMHPRDARTFDQLVDSTGQPLRPSDWVGSLNRATSTVFPNESGETSMVVGDFSNLLIAYHPMGTMMKLFDAGTANGLDGQPISAVENFAYILRVVMRVDIVCLRPSWFCALSGVTNS